MNEAKENNKDVKFLVKMYFGIEESFNDLLFSVECSQRSRLQLIEVS